MASSERRIFNKVMVDAAMTLVSEKYPDEYQKFVSDSSNKQKMKQEAEKCVEEITTVIRNVRDKSMKTLEALSHLSEDRKQRFRQALGMKTFEMKIGQGEVSVTRGDKEFRSKMMLSSSAGIGEATDLQTASIVIECVIFVLEVMGVAIPDDEEEVQRAIQIVLDYLKKSNDLAQDIDVIKEAYENGDLAGMAKGILTLVIDVFADGIFWDITKALLSDMAWYDWILTSAKIAAMIAALVATGGLADIAELVSILVDAQYFVKKLANLASFQNLKAITESLNNDGQL